MSSFPLLILCVFLVLCIEPLECSIHTVNTNCTSFAGVGILAQCSCHIPEYRICVACRWVPPQSSSPAQIQPPAVNIFVADSQVTVFCTYNFLQRVPNVTQVERHSSCGKYLVLFSKLYEGIRINNTNVHGENDTSRWGFCLNGSFGCNYTIAVENSLKGQQQHKGETFYQRVGSFAKDYLSSHIRLGTRYYFEGCGEDTPRFRFRVPSTEETHLSTPGTTETREHQHPSQQTPRTHNASSRLRLLTNRALLTGVVTVLLLSLVRF